MDRIPYPVMDQPSITIPSANLAPLLRDIQQDVRFCASMGMTTDSFELTLETMFANGCNWERIHPEIVPYLGAQ